MIEILATIMGILMSLGYYPQAYKIWKTKSARDVSLISFFVFSIGTLTWLIYGFYINDWPIMLSFSLGVVGSWLVLVLTIIYKGNHDLLEN